MRAWGPALLLALTLAATGIVYRPLLSVYFVGDDFLHLFAINDAPLGEYLLRPHGGHLLMTRNAVFVAFYRLFGMHAEWYFWVVLFTHLLNTFLLFRVVANWTESVALAAFGALSWAVSPTHAGTLDWYSVYGQALVATILLVILRQISSADRRTAQLPTRIVVVWPLLLIIAGTCFGVGIGLIMLAPVAFYLLLPPARVRLGVCSLLAIIALLTPTVYKALILYHDQLVGSYAHGWAMAVSFGSLQYRAAILRMFGWLLSCGITNLLLHFAAPAHFPSLAAIVVTVIYVIVVAVAFFAASAPVRRRLLGLLVLAVATYGIIAAGRATFLPIPKIATFAAIPRYHYVGMIPLSIILCCAVAQLTASSPRRERWHYALLATTGLVASLFYWRSKPFIDPHLAARRETTAVITQVDAAIAQAPAGGDVLIENRAFKSVGFMLNDYRSGFPGWAGIFVMTHPDNVVDGKHVRFIVDDPQLVQAFGSGKRSRDLFQLTTPCEPSPPVPVPST